MRRIINEGIRAYKYYNYYKLTFSAISSAGETEVGHQRKIIELRGLLAQKFPAMTTGPARSRLATGVEALDHSLDGGLPEGALTEIVCPAGSMGSGTIIQALVETGRTLGRPLALVDAVNSFDPDGLVNTDLSALLWVQCTGGVEQALRATDILLRDGNMRLVMLDLMLCSARQVRSIPSTYWYRLQRVAEGNGATALIFTPALVVGGAASTLRLTRRFELSVLDLLRDQLMASLSVVNVRARTRTLFGQESAIACLAD